MNLNWIANRDYQETDDCHCYQITKCLGLKDTNTDDYCYRNILQSLGNIGLLKQNLLQDAFYIGAIYNTGRKGEENPLIILRVLTSVYNC